MSNYNYPGYGGQPPPGGNMWQQQYNNPAMNAQQQNYPNMYGGPPQATGMPTQGGYYQQGMAPAQMPNYTFTFDVGQPAAPQPTQQPTQMILDSDIFDNTKKTFDSFDPFKPNTSSNQQKQAPKPVAKPQRSQQSRQQDQKPQAQGKMDVAALRSVFSEENEIKQDGDFLQIEIKSNSTTMNQTPPAFPQYNQGARGMNNPAPYANQQMGMPVQQQNPGQVPFASQPFVFQMPADTNPVPQQQIPPQITPVFDQSYGINQNEIENQTGIQNPAIQAMQQQTIASQVQQPATAFAPSFVNNNNKMPDLAENPFLGASVNTKPPQIPVTQAQSNIAQPQQPSFDFISIEPTPTTNKPNSGKTDIHDLFGAATPASDSTGGIPKIQNHILPNQPPVSPSRTSAPLNPQINLSNQQIGGFNTQDPMQQYNMGMPNAYQQQMYGPPTNMYMNQPIPPYPQQVPSQEIVQNEAPIQQTEMNEPKPDVFMDQFDPFDPRPRPNFSEPKPVEKPKPPMQPQFIEPVITTPVIKDVKDLRNIFGYQEEEKSEPKIEPTPQEPQEIVEQDQIPMTPQQLPQQEVFQQPQQQLNESSFSFSSAQTEKIDIPFNPFASGFNPFGQANPATTPVVEQQNKVEEKQPTQELTSSAGFSPFGQPPQSPSRSAQVEQKQSPPPAQNGELDDIWGSKAFGESLSTPSANQVSAPVQPKKSENNPFVAAPAQSNPFVSNRQDNIFDAPTTEPNPFMAQSSEPGPVFQQQPDNLFGNIPQDLFSVPPNANTQFNEQNQAPASQPMPEIEIPELLRPKPEPKVMQEFDPFDPAPRQVVSQPAQEKVPPLRNFESHVQHELPKTIETSVDNIRNLFGGPVEEKEPPTETKENEPEPEKEKEQEVVVPSMNDMAFNFASHEETQQETVTFNPFTSGFNPFSQPPKMAEEAPVDQPIPLNKSTRRLSNSAELFNLQNARTNELKAEPKSTDSAPDYDEFISMSPPHSTLTNSFDDSFGFPQPTQEKSNPFAPPKKEEPNPFAQPKKEEPNPFAQPKKEEPNPFAQPKKEEPNPFAQPSSPFSSNKDTPKQQEPSPFSKETKPKEEKQEQTKEEKSESIPKEGSSKSSILSLFDDLGSSNPEPSEPKQTASFDFDFDDFTKPATESTQSTPQQNATQGNDLLDFLGVPKVQEQPKPQPPPQMDMLDMTEKKVIEEEIDEVEDVKPRPPPQNNPFGPIRATKLQAEVKVKRDESIPTFEAFGGGSDFVFSSETMEPPPDMAFTFNPFDTSSASTTTKESEVKKASAPITKFEEILRDYIQEPEEITNSRFEGKLQPGKPFPKFTQTIAAAKLTQFVIDQFGITPHFAKSASREADDSENVSSVFNARTEVNEDDDFLLMI